MHILSLLFVYVLLNFAFGYRQNRLLIWIHVKSIVYYDTVR